MKTLTDIVNAIDPSQVIGFRDTRVTGISYLAEQVTSGHLFACIDEFLKYDHWIEGQSQLELIPTNGLSGLICQHPVPSLPIPQLIVKDPLKSTALAAKSFYDAPDEELFLVGVTGTNGKTTISHLISHLIHHARTRCASMGTLGVFENGGKLADSVYTTPLSVDLYCQLKKLVSMNINALAMEISSHSLKLDRVYGLDIDVAVLSNITRDHIDFHKTMDDYVASKQLLFSRMKSNGTAVINMDDPMGPRFAMAANCPVIGYGISTATDVMATDIRYYPDGTEFMLTFQGQSYPVKTHLIGDFNVANTLAAVAACIPLGLDIKTITTHLPSFASVNGRMEIVKLPKNRIGIIDYAHTPDALEKILRTIRKTTNSRIITVFGCGGDRDRGKRPLMGKIAEQLSDMAVVTSDNPRTEAPNQIIADILEGMTGACDYLVEPDRRKAIAKAYELSLPGDILVVAGKGHETYQILGTQRIHFSDKEELLCLINPTATPNNVTSAN